MLLAAAALLPVTCVAAAAMARADSPRGGHGPQTANLSADTTTALTDNWYESAPYYSVYTGIHDLRWPGDD
jgi:hypothetical protein